jgi:hypothetical protein
VLLRTVKSDRNYLGYSKCTITTVFRALTKRNATFSCGVMFAYIAQPSLVGCKKMVKKCLCKGLFSAISDIYRINNIMVNSALRRSESPGEIGSKLFARIPCYCTYSPHGVKLTAGLNVVYPRPFLPVQFFSRGTINVVNSVMRNPSSVFHVCRGMAKHWPTRRLSASKLCHPAGSNKKGESK